jgi:hypothetical protein
MYRLLLINFIFIEIAASQNTGSPATSILSGPNLPARCAAAANNIFFKINSGPTAVPYYCDTANHWTLWTGGSGSGCTVAGNTGDLQMNSTGNCAASGVHQDSNGINGTELISHTNFGTPANLSGWSNTTGWSIVASKLTHTPGSTTALTTTVTPVSVGSLFLLTLVVNTSTAGSVQINLGTGCLSDCLLSVNSSGTKTKYFVVFALADAGVVEIVPTTDSNISITSISLKEVRGQFDFYNTTGDGMLNFKRDNSNALSSIGLGKGALVSLTTGNADVAVGAGALMANTSGITNVAIGHTALTNNTTGNANTGVGYQALWQNTTASNNTAFGTNALADNLTGSTNTAVGTDSLATGTTFTDNTAVGYRALWLATGINNTAMGARALSANSAAHGGSAFGLEALKANTTGNFNTAMGFAALTFNTTGTENTSLGDVAGYYNTTGSNNTFIGAGAGFGGVLSSARTGSSNNTMIGAFAGNNAITTNSSGNVFLGYQAGLNEAGSNFLYIDNKGGSATTALVYGKFNADPKAQLFRTNGVSQRLVMAVGDLPTCDASLEGGEAGVNDALTPVALAAVASGGSVHVPVYCDGTNWIVQ